MSYKVAMVFSDGERTPVAEPQDNIKPCLSDPYIEKLLRHWLSQYKQTQGLMIVWGNGIIETINVIDETKMVKKLEGLINEPNKTEQG